MSAPTNRDTPVRLKTIWWPSRKSMYPGFFVFVLTEFASAHGDLAVPQKPAK